MHDYEAPTFYIKGGGLAFSDRQKGVFDQLVGAEKETTERQRENKVVYMKNDDEDNSFMDLDISKPPRRQCKKFRGKESIFKVPDVPPLKPSALPDFKKNPHRWVKYSLGDVSQDDMSEQANRSAAMSFLHELDERKKREAEDYDGDGSGSDKKPIKFRRPNKASEISLEKEKLLVTPGDEEVKPYFRSSKLIMPEYVVGEKKPKKKARRETKVDSPDTTGKSNCVPIKLGHLIEDDEIE